MRQIRRTRKASMLVAATAAVLVAGTLPAHAAGPTWEPGGYVPKGENCLSFPAGPEPLVPAPTAYIYLDSQRPKVQSVDANKVIRVGNTPAPASLIKVRATQTCSGLLGMVGLVKRPDGQLIEWEQLAEPTDGNYHDYTFDLRSDNSAEDVKTIGLGDLGAYTLEWGYTVPRFQEFVLDAASKNLLGSDGEVTEETIAPLRGDGTQTSFALRDTKASAVKVSKKKVKKGKKVTVSTGITVANGAGYTGLGGQKVSLQRKLKGSDAWTTVKTGGTAANGSISLSDKPKKSATYRLDFAGTFTAPWNAPVVSSEAAVKVKGKKVAKKDAKKDAKKAKKGSKKND